MERQLSNRDAEIAVVGAGIGGLRTVEALRRQGFEGRLRLLGDEPTLPYNRPPLSKEVLTGKHDPEAVALTTWDRLRELDVDVELGAAVDGAGIEERRLVVGGTAYRPDAVVVATGVAAATLPWADGLDGAQTLRTLADAIALRDRLATCQRLVVVGAGFVGSEVAASARALGVEVTIVERDAVPLGRVLGPTIGERLVDLHATNGTRVLLGRTVTRAHGGPVQRLELDDGTVLDADCTLVSVGARPRTEWLGASRVATGNGVACDASLATSAPGVYAVGDVASWPNPLFGRRMRVEHWTNASDQARHVAKEIVHGDAGPFLGSGYVWSDQYGKRLQFVGSSSDAHEVKIVHGPGDAGGFVAWYRHGTRLVGALAVDSPKLLLQSRTLIEARHDWEDALLTLTTPN